MSAGQKTYSELLQDWNWHRKRSDILKRDNLKCQLCQNSRIEQSSFKGKLISLKHVCRHSLQEISSYHPNFYHLKEIMVKFRANDGYTELEAYANAFERFTENEQDELKDAEIFYKIDPSEKNKIILAGIKTTKGNHPSKWLHAEELHVHHTYYQQGLNPWEYPDASLQTLCRKCHEQLHENESIPIKNLYGRIVGSLKYHCSKCNGTGYLPEYSYHQSGICFDCKGEKDHLLKYPG